MFGAVGLADNQIILGQSDKGFGTGEFSLRVDMDEVFVILGELRFGEKLRKGNLNGFRSTLDNKTLRTEIEDKVWGVVDGEFMDSILGEVGNLRFEVEGVVEGGDETNKEVETEKVFDRKGEVGLEDVAIVTGFGDGFDIGTDEGTELGDHGDVSIAFMSI